MADLGRFQRVLVTGATGFLAGHVVAELTRRGIDIVAVGRNEAKLAGLGCAVLKHDISRPFSSNDVPDIDAIVHCAALSAPFGSRKDFMAANVDGTGNLLDLAGKKQVQRVVHVSTPSVYFSYQDQLDIAENHPLPPPVNHYAQTKAMAEDMVMQQLGHHSIILRPRGIYGPGDTALLPRVLQAANQRPLPLLRGGQAAIDLTYVSDVVDAIITALAAPDDACGEAYNVSGGEMLPVRAIVDQACQRAGITPRWRKVPLRVAMGVAAASETIAAWRKGAPEPAITRYGLGLFAYRQSLDIHKARTHLGWSPKVRFKEGLARTFEGMS
ncbi:NAD(P)-dependent oxidoreductase [Octadecabacter sp. G9-8]|uniref:NAD(P)-dependent oxidoreductase n=1 Tax=Octadecabacter dasysiphoniae TaxID=2909341 RepID=A0ABS9CUQ8_9RHOB|nr:NAD(P)-dependent oxidoreductase [Octadecabacter dasysiphoniae]MCF2870671.1 NAD(P)-dependent oxidoreductase [Octadecabacter dasysiphoniae]